MEHFASVVRLARREENNLVYAEYEPENIELKDVTFHGMTLPINGTVEETISAYQPIATAEMFKQVNRIFPGAYSI